MSFDESSVFRNLVDFGITFLDEDGSLKINGDLFREKLSSESALGGPGVKTPVISGS